MLPNRPQLPSPTNPPRAAALGGLGSVFLQAVQGSKPPGVNDLQDDEFEGKGFGGPPARADLSGVGWQSVSFERVEITEEDFSLSAGNDPRVFRGGDGKPYRFIRGRQARLLKLDAPRFRGRVFHDVGLHWHALSTTYDPDLIGNVIVAFTDQDGGNIYDWKRILHYDKGPGARADFVNSHEFALWWGAVCENSKSLGLEVPSLADFDRDSVAMTYAPRPGKLGPVAVGFEDDVSGNSPEGKPRSRFLTDVRCTFTEIRSATSRGKGDVAGGVEMAWQGEALLTVDTLTRLAVIQGVPYPDRYTEGEKTLLVNTIMTFIEKLVSIILAAVTFNFGKVISGVVDEVKLWYNYSELKDVDAQASARETQKDNQTKSIEGASPVVAMTYLPPRPPARPSAAGGGSSGGSVDVPAPPARSDLAPTDSGMGHIPTVALLAGAALLFILASMD